MIRRMHSLVERVGEPIAEEMAVSCLVERGYLREYTRVLALYPVIIDAVN